jgi:hypothetical protein
MSRAALYPIGPVRNQGLDTIALAQSLPKDFALFSDAKKLLCETPLFVLAKFFQPYCQLQAN